jgi:hypothetical protein
MDTSYFFPNVNQQISLGLNNAFSQQEQPYRMALLQQSAEQGGLNLEQARLALAGAYQNFGLNSAFNSLLQQRLNEHMNGGSVPQPVDNTPQSLAPQQQPGATGGGGSSGGSGGSNGYATGAPSSTNPVTGAAPSSQGTPGYGPDLSDNSSIAIGNVLGLSPQEQELLGIHDPARAKAMQESQAAALKSAQLNAQDRLNFLESVRNSPSPARVVMSNPGMMARWQQMAPQLGIDPRNPDSLTDDNVRFVMGVVANHLRGQVGLPAQKYEQYVTSTGPAGERIQTEVTTGKENQVSGENLKQVVGPDGKPQYLPADQAAGKTPFNATLFGAASMSDDAITLQAQMALANGGKLPSSLGRNPLMQAKVSERMAQLAHDQGQDGSAIIYAGNARKAYGGALDNLTKLQTATNAYSDTLDKNLNSLLEAAKAAGGTNSPLVNRALRAYQQGFAGDPDTQKMVTYLNAVESEYAKLSSGSLGNAPISDAAKKDAKDVINKALTQGGFEAVAQAMRQEAQNKKDAYAAQISDLQGKLGASPNQQAQGSAQAPAAKAGAPQEGAKSTSKSGKPIVFANGHWQYQ